MAKNHWLGLVRARCSVARARLGLEKIGLVPPLIQPFKLNTTSITWWEQNAGHFWNLGKFIELFLRAPSLDVTPYFCDHLNAMALNQLPVNKHLGPAVASDAFDINGYVSPHSLESHIHLSGQRSESLRILYSDPQLNHIVTCLLRYIRQCIKMDQLKHVWTKQCKYKFLFGL